MVWLVVLLCALTCFVMILGVLFFPKIKLGKVEIGSYWVVTLIGAAAVLATGRVPLSAIGRALVRGSSINPVKILVLFLSMTVLSIFLDEMHFFRYLAAATLRRARSGQKRLFLYLYLIVSLLTVFTSNDVIILSFTPFICYFAKNAEIDPKPYLAAEFVAANTWSLALMIGNPTNIYLATATGVGFLSYMKISLLPTFAAGAVALLALYLLFRKKLSAPISGEAEKVTIPDRFLLWTGIVHLAVCTVLLAIGSYIGLEMWPVALGAVVSLFLFVSVSSLVRKRPPRELLACIRRAPFELVPFVLSMFVMILVLGEKGVTAKIGAFFGTRGAVWTYGGASFLFANLINNIPMSVLFSSILVGAGASGNLGAVFATIVGSNLGALFTPIGALAGIMFGSILDRHGVRFGIFDFLKIGVAVALPALAAALGALQLTLLFV